MNDPIKVYDARWEAGEFPDDRIRRLFEATLLYGRRLGADAVTLARDARLDAGHVLELAVDVATRAGFRTFVCPDPISTPHSYFLTYRISQEHPRTLGLTITASHNPRQYVGVKFVVPGMRAIGLDCGPDGGLTAVRRIYHGDETLPATPGGSLRIVNVRDEYIDFSMRQAGVPDGGLRGLRVVLDTLNGSAGPEIHAALQRAGAEVEPIRLIPDGGFSTGSPNPTSRGKMDLAVTRTAELGCHATVGVDGDGDRIVFGDRRGLLSAGFAAVPILRAAARANARDRTPPVLYDPKVSPLALVEWSRLGVRPVLFRNGHSQIKDYMRRIDAVAGAEESGHYYHRLTMGGLTACCENSLLTILLFLDAVRARPGLLDDLWRLQSGVRTTGEVNYQFDDDATRDRAMAAVIRHFVDAGADAATATPDGVDLQGTVLSRGVASGPAGIDLRPGWFSGYLRIATNERAVARSYFSAGDADVLEEMAAATHRILGRDFGGRLID